MIPVAAEPVGFEQHVDVVVLDVVGGFSLVKIQRSSELRHNDLLLVLLQSGAHLSLSCSSHILLYYYSVFV